VVRDVPYCEQHAHLVQQRTDSHRPSAAKRGYGRRWRKLRSMFLSTNPLCADPFNVHGGYPSVATDVDHILPLTHGGSNTWDNLQALCTSCHSRKTASEGKGRGHQISGAFAP
jgi:5-methylcytosine-specific restriction protein A